MPLTTLKEDLLAEFRDERIMISDQIALLDPIATSLRRPAARRLFSSTTLVISEVFCYLLGAGGIAGLVLLNRIYSFSQVYQLVYAGSTARTGVVPNVAYLTGAVYGSLVVGTALAVILGIAAGKIRRKNAILCLAGKDIQTIVGQHLERRAALDTLEQRHMLGLSGIQVPKKQTSRQSATLASPSMAEASTHIIGIPDSGFE